MEEFDARRAAMDLVTAFVSNNKLGATELPTLLTEVFNAISGFVAHEAPPANAEPAAPEPAQALIPSSIEENEPVLAEITPPAAPARPAPAVSIENSVSNPDFILSLITGEKFKTLKRHLRAHGLTEAEYRDRYNLPTDYRFVAPSYSETRRKVAAKMGLGRRSTPKPEAAAVSETTPPVTLEPEAAPPEKPKRATAKSAKPTPGKAKSKRAPKAASLKPNSAAAVNKASADQEAETEASPRVGASAADATNGAPKDAAAVEIEEAAPAESISVAVDKPRRAKRAAGESKKSSPPRKPTAAPSVRSKSVASDNVATQVRSRKAVGRKRVTAPEASSPAETSSATVEPSFDTTGGGTKPQRPRRKLSPAFS